MDWTVEHRIEAPLHAVEASVLATTTLEAIVARQSIVGRVHVVALTSGPGWQERVADYEPNVPDRLLPRIVQRDWIGWREVVRWDTHAHEGTIHIRPRLPERFQDRFVFQARYCLVGDGDETTRRVHGKLVIRAPVVGSAIEGWVSERLQASFDQEAQVVQDQALLLHL
ncbi:MAG: DUF2505 family protein [Myxococcales bacterium]|nr:DUF2505 family protein [Myxococcales bacterium]